MSFLERTKSIWVLIGIGISSMMLSIDFTIVNTALPVLQKTFHAKMSELQWVMGSFGISFATLLIIMGRLGDVFGKRRILYIGMCGFLITSIAAGFSQTILALIIFRFLQGIFAATIFPCGMGLIAENFPPEKRGKAMGGYSGLLGVGLAFGPVVGGIIVTYLDWRWLFFINVPVLLLSFLISLPVLKESKKIDETIDVFGMLLFILGFGSLVFAITEGPNLGWSAWPILIAFLATIVFLFFFVRAERKSKMPLLPPTLLHNRRFFLGTSTRVVSVSVAWPLLFLLPLYLQNILGFSPVTAGAILLAMTVMTAVMPPIAGHLYDKKPMAPLVLFAFLLLFVGYLLQLFFGMAGPVWLILIALIIFGFGWGFGNGLAAPIALSHLPSTEKAGIVTGALMSIMNVAGVLLLSIIGAIFRYAENVRLTHLVKRSGVTLTEEQQTILNGALSNPDSAKEALSQLGNNFVPIFKQSFMTGFHFSIMALILFTLIMLVSMSSPLLNEKTTKGHS